MSDINSLSIPETAERLGASVSSGNCVMLVINPISGTRDKDDVVEMLSDALNDTGRKLEVVVTQGSGDARSAAARAVQRGLECVIVAGGDGTVREVASALVNTPVNLGIIPCGSGNGLARTLQIPSDFRQAVEIAVGGNVIKCDYGLAEGQPFFCTFGVGFDAAVTDKYSSQKRRGKMSYVRSAIQEYFNYTPESYGLEINGRIITRNALLIAVCNASQYGNNAYIAPGASLCDGLLDVVVMHRGSTLREALGAVDLLTGNLDKNTLIEQFRVPKLAISRLQAGAVQFDGEAEQLGRVIHIECCPAALNLIAPAKTEEFRPVLTPLRSMIADAQTDVQYLLKTLFQSKNP